MSGGRVSIGQSFKTKTSVVKINILVVDDDSTSLAIVTAMLKTWKYGVTTVKSPVDALSTLRVRDSIDLVVTDLHMPGMSGIELQKQIDEEFKLPVIIMSSDDKDSVILESLACGAVFYIVKPINPDDLKNVWQYAISAKKGKSIVIEEIGSIQGVSSVEKITFEDINSQSSVNEEKRGKKDCKRKASKRSKDDQLEDDHKVAPKKAKVVWTTSLHNRFLQAIKHIGLEKAVPKRILEFMNVPGLTRENVASHLQKYRIFLKRVADKVGSSKSLTDRTMRSSFASGHPSLMFKNVQQEYPQFTGQQQMRTPFQPGFGGNISALNAANVGFMRFPNQEGSNSRSVPQLGYGQSRLLSNQPMFGNKNPLYQANRHAFGTTLSSNGGISYGRMDGKNSMQMYQPQTQARPDFYNIGASSNYNFAASSNHNFGASGSRGPNNMSNSSYNNNNYAGIRLTSDGELVGMGPMRINVDGFNGGMMNGIGNDNVTVSDPKGNGTFGYLAQGGSSSAQFESANQCPPPLNIVNQQQDPSVLPPLPQRQLGLGNGGGANDFSFDPPQFGEGDLSDLLFESTNFQFPHEKQGGDGVLNADFPNSSYNAEVTPTLNQLLNVDLPIPFQLGDDAPWNEQSLGQLPGSEEVVNPDFGGSAFLLEDYYPSFGQNPTQQQGTGDLVDSEIYNMYPVDNAPSGNQTSNNQTLGDDFMDSLFGNGPY